MSDDYERRLADWKKRNGVPEERVNEDIPAGELRMIVDDAKSTGQDYCWICAEQFPIKDMVVETSPYNQMEDDAIEDDGYIKPENRVRKCKACVKREEDEENGIEEGQEP
jgi:hypothetical protein